MKTPFALAALCLAVLAAPAAADSHVLYGFKLGQEVRLVKAALGEPAKVIPFDDGWKAYVYPRKDHVVVFEADQTRPDVVISIQLEGKQNPSGMGLDGVDLGTDAKAAAARLGRETAREPATDEVTRQPIPGTFIHRFGDPLSFEEKDGKVTSIKVIFTAPSEAPAAPDLAAFLRDVKERKLFRVAEAVSSDLTVGGERAVKGPILGQLSGKTALSAFLFGKDGVASLSAPQAEADLRVIGGEDGKPGRSGPVFKFKGKKVHELFFVRSFEGWVLYEAW
jgi:hypothetical protein